MSNDSIQSAPPDLAQVVTPAELGMCLRALLDEKGLSYSTLAKAADRLAVQHGGAQPLPKSTVSDVLTGKRVPPRDKLLTMLAACDVPADEVPQWLAAWQRARQAPSATATAPVEPVESVDPPSWRSRALLVAVTAVVAAGLTTGVFLLTGVGPTRDPAGNVAAVVIQNQYAGGPSELIENNGPAYLSAATIPWCSSHACEVPGTEMQTGALLAVTCHVTGSKMYNYNVSDALVYQNPNRVESTLWYRGVFPDGKTGYISEVKIAARYRGGLGLPECTH